MSNNKKQVRAVWPLLKARITNITEGGCSIMIGAEFGSPTTMHIKSDMRGYDLRDGDIVTLYTEIPLKPNEGEA